MKHIGNLSYSQGAKKNKKRIARGQGSGYGRTAGRGHKGQKSRSGATIGLNFEGGQMPIDRRLPKFGFFNRFRTEYQVVNLGTLQDLVDNKKIEGNEVDFDLLFNLGIINKKSALLKILGNGDLNTALNIKADKFTNSAKEKIESAGGTAVLNG